MTTWAAGMRITASRLNDNTATTTTTGLTAATGFSVNTFSGRRVHGVTTVNVFCTRTGADITATSGNITDTLMATLPSGWQPPEGINAAWGNGATSGECTIGPDGAINLRTSSSNISGTAGSGASNLRVCASWISEND